MRPGNIRQLVLVCALMHIPFQGVHHRSNTNSSSPSQHLTSTVASNAGPVQPLSNLNPCCCISQQASITVTKATLTYKMAGADALAEAQSFKTPAPAKAPAAAIPLPLQLNAAL
jgi:hypothetical protein